MAKFLLADPQGVQHVGRQLVVGEPGQPLGIRLGSLLLLAAVVETLATMEKGLGNQLAPRILGDDGLEGLGRRVIQLGLARPGQVVQRGPETVVGGIEQFERRVVLHYDLEALPGQLQLIRFQVADAEVVKCPIAARIGIEGVDELHPLLGGEPEIAAILQRHGRAVLLRG